MSESFKTLEISEQAHRHELLKFKEETLEQSKNLIVLLLKKTSIRSSDYLSDFVSGQCFH